MTDTLVIDLIRHGEPEGGVMYRGSQDDPLSPTGWQQMQRCWNIAQAEGNAWDLILSSPMKRCRAFAEWAAREAGIPLEVEDSLREMHFGDLEGLRPAEAWAQHGELLKALWASPETVSPPNGETFPTFVARVGGVLDALASRTDAQHVLVVAHGGVIRATLRHWLNIRGTDTFRIDVPYAGMSRLKVYRQSDAPFTVSLGFINGYRGA